MIDKCEELRTKCKEVEKKIRELLQDDFFLKDQSFLGQFGEVKANITLAFRHLEDARMRLEKVIQYARDGVSVFDKQ